MGFLFSAVIIKFFFQKRINGGVERIRRRTRRFNAQSSVHVKAPRAFDKVLKPRAADLKWQFRCRVKQIACSLIIIFRHKQQLNSLHPPAKSQSADRFGIPDLFILEKFFNLRFGQRTKRNDFIGFMVTSLYL